MGLSYIPFSINLGKFLISFNLLITFGSSLIEQIHILNKGCLNNS